MERKSLRPHIREALSAASPPPLASAEGPPRSQETQERFAEVAVDPVFVQSLADSLKGHREISAKYGLDLSY